jgi:hypothetical protein
MPVRLQQKSPNVNSGQSACLCAKRLGIEAGDVNSTAEFYGGVSWTKFDPAFKKIRLSDASFSVRSQTGVEPGELLARIQSHQLAYFPNRQSFRVTVCIIGLDVQSSGTRDQMT